MPPDSASPSVKPRQRSSSATLPTSWLTQSAFVTPASPIRCPAPTPASYSVWPTWVSTPSSAATSLPEFIEITGMPASTAALDRLAERVGVRDRDDQAVRLGGDGGVDQLRHRDHVEGVRRLVLDLDAHILGGLVDAVLDDRPERVGGLTVGDDDEAQVAAIGSVILAERPRADPDEADTRPGRTAQPISPYDSSHSPCPTMAIRGPHGPHP